MRNTDYILNENDQWPVPALQDKLKELNLENAACRLVLSLSQYELFLLEAPSVPEEEMAEALRWRVKDLISYSIDSAIVTLFPLPEDSNRSGRKMIYAVVAEKSEIERSIKLIEEIGLTLKSIDIQELAHRNLAERVSDDNRGVAVISLNDGKGNIQLFKGPDLYLTRKFDVRYSGGLFEELPSEQLVLEIQRSLDYYERQMGQVPPRDIFLTGENISPDKISEELSGGIAGQLGILSPESLLTVSDSVDETLLQTCVPAIGAALRGGA